MAYKLTKEEYEDLKRAKTNFNALVRQTIYNHPETKDAFEQITSSLSFKDKPSIAKTRITTLSKSFETKEDFERTLTVFKGLKGRTKTITQDTGEKTIEFAHFLYQEGRKIEEEIKAKRTKELDPSAYRGTEMVQINANLLPKAVETKEELKKKELATLYKGLKVSQNRSRKEYWREQDKQYKDNFMTAVKKTWGEKTANILKPYIESIDSEKFAKYSLSYGNSDIASVYTEDDASAYIARAVKHMEELNLLSKEDATELTEATSSL